MDTLSLKKEARIYNGILTFNQQFQDFSDGIVVKNPPAMQETQETLVSSLGQEDPLEQEMATHSSFFSGKFHGQRNLVGYSPKGYKMSDTTEELSTHTHSHRDTHTHTHTYTHTHRGN